MTGQELRAEGGVRTAAPGRQGPHSSHCLQKRGGTRRGPGSRTQGPCSLGPRKATASRDTKAIEAGQVIRSHSWSHPTTADRHPGCRADTGEPAAPGMAVQTRSAGDRWPGRLLERPRRCCSLESHEAHSSPPPAQRPARPLCQARQPRFPPSQGTERVSQSRPTMTAHGLTQVTFR